MQNIRIRNLKPDEIECRIGSITEKGITLLLYKNARVDQAILDETFGIFGWQRSHEMIGESLYCTISIWDSEKECWISKQDVGTESDFERQKGAASDSFKRAGFNVGVGRELYTSPVIWVSADRLQLGEKDHRKYCKDRFRVKSIEISEEKVITGLAIENQRGETVFAYQSARKKEKTTDGRPWEELYRELERTGISKEKILKRYQIQRLEEMDETTCQRALAGLKKTPSAA